MSEKKAEQLRKITTKEVGWERAAVAEKVIKAGKPVLLYTVIGVVNNFKPGSTTMGDFAKLVGEFEAINLETGAVFQSSACILPNFIGDGIAGALSRPNAEAVQFAITIGAKPDAKSVTGFVYTADNALPPSPHSPLAQLKAQIATEKLLPKPKGA